MATLEMNVRQVNSDFQSIKKTVNDAVRQYVFEDVITDGTKTSEYHDKIVKAIDIIGRAQFIDGSVDGIEEGRKEGREAAYNEFWQNAVPIPNAHNGVSAFAGRAWNENTFKPPNKITLTNNCNNCFYNSGVSDITPYVEFQGITSFNSAFQYSTVTAIPPLNLSNVSWITNSFVDAKFLTSLELTVVETANFNAAFTNTIALTKLIIKGTIGKNGFNVQWSPLTHDSLMSIINALKDYSDDTSGTEWKVIIGSENYAKLTTDEILIAEQKGWSIE